MLQEPNNLEGQQTIKTDTLTRLVQSSVLCFSVEFANITKSCIMIYRTKKLIFFCSGKNKICCSLWLLCVFCHPFLGKSGQRSLEVLDMVALLYKWLSGQTRWRLEESEEDIKATDSLNTA